MERRPAEPVVGHVVHLVDSLSEAPAAPRDLQFRRRMGSTARVLLALLLTAVTAASGILVWVLWTSDTPGWWFSALFTVMTLGVPIGGWAGYAESIRRAGLEAVAQREWAASWQRARPFDGRVTDREVGLNENGYVVRFSLTVGAPLLPEMLAVWRAGSGAKRGDLLQPQVPGVGAPVRVWVVGDDGDRPLVVEVADPTIVVDRA